MLLNSTACWESSARCASSGYLILISCMAIYKSITNRSYCIVVHIICTSRESGMKLTENLGAAFQIVMARTEKQAAASMAGTSHFSRERTRDILCPHQRMPFGVRWQKAGADLCPKKEKHSSDALPGRRGKCCSLFPALCGICGESKDVVSFSFQHLQQLLSWPARSLFLCLLFSAQKLFHMKPGRNIHYKLTVALAFISFLPCLSWLSIKDSFIFSASPQAVRWGCIWTTQHSAETFQSCAKPIMSMAGSSGLMLTWCLPGLASSLIQEYPWDGQVINWKQHIPSRCAVTRGNLNHVLGCAVQDSQCLVDPSQECNK